MTATIPLTFDAAADLQYRRHSYYTIWFVSPAGERIAYLGCSPRKSGVCLRDVMMADDVRPMLLATLCHGDDEVSVRKTAAAIHFGTGHRIEFGGTVRQEAAELSRDATGRAI